VLCKLFATFTSEKVTDFIHLIFATTIDLYQMTDLSDMQQEVLEYPEFEHLKINFITSYKQAVEYTLAGLLKWFLINCR
jgi:hypothetical protein